MKEKQEKDILQITQIKIKLPSKEIELSADEAKKVYEELGKLFIKEKSNLEKFKEEYDKIVPQKEYIPYPIYIDRYIKEPYWTYPQIWCATDPMIKTTCLSINLTNQI